jgi:hypothetical protein
MNDGWRLDVLGGMIDRLSERKTDSKKVIGDKTA